MSWKPTDKEVESLIRLPGAKRYEYFVKRVVDMEELWGLWEDGWCMLGDPQDRQCIPVWPHPRYAQLCATDDWARAEPRSIPLDKWLESWTPGMQGDGIFVAVFPTPTLSAVVVPPERLEADLRRELLKYEAPDE